MDKAKYDAYKLYDWGNDPKWQQYLNGLYPIPPREKLEKMRKKWYKKNKVSDFDADFNEEEFLKSQQSQGAGMSDQQRFQQQYYQQYQQQNPGAAYSAQQSNFTDRAPQFAQLHIMLWVGYFVTLVLGQYSTIVGLAANGIGLVRKAGMPTWSAIQQYFQSVVFQDEFHNMTYMMATMMSSGGLFVSGPIIVSGLLFLATDFQKKLRANPSFPVLSMGMIKTYIDKGASPEMQTHGRQMKADMEVYCGFYLIAMVLLGGQSILGAVMYWQMTRMRYMLSQPLQQGFQRLDQKILGVVQNPRCPSFINSGYMGLRSILQSMTDSERQQQQAAQGGGGIMGAMKNSCSIF